MAARTEPSGEADWCRREPPRQNRVVVIVAVIAAAAATVAWSRLRRDGARRAPDVIDLVVVVMVSLTAAVTVSGPAL